MAVDGYTANLINSQRQAQGLPAIPAEEMPESLLQQYLSGGGVSDPEEMAAQNQARFDQVSQDPLQALSPEVAAVWGQRPEFESIMGEGGRLQDEFQLQAQGPDVYSIGQEQIGGVDLSRLGLEGLQEQALTPSQESAWLKMATDQQRLEEQALRDEAVQQALSGASQAQAGLAMRGGLSSGARERIAQQAGRNLTAARQDVGRTGMQQRAGLGVQAEENRLRALSQLPGAELGAAQFDLTKAKSLTDLAGQERQFQTGLEQFNLEQALQERGRGQQSEMDKWRELMQAYGSERSAQAQEKAAQK